MHRLGVIHVQKAGGDPVPDALVTMALSSGVVEPSKFQNGSYSFDKLNVPKEDLGSVNIDVRWHDLHKVQKTLLPAKFPSSRQLVVTVDLPAGDSPLRVSYAILRDQAIDLFLRDLWDAKWNSDLGIKRIVFQNATYRELMRLSRKFASIDGALDTFEDTKRHIPNKKLANKLLANGAEFFVGDEASSIKVPVDEAFFDRGWHAVYAPMAIGEDGYYSTTSDSDKETVMGLRMLGHPKPNDKLINFSFWKFGTRDDVDQFAKLFNQTDPSFGSHPESDNKRLRLYKELSKNGIPEGFFPIVLDFQNFSTECMDDNDANTWVATLLLRSMQLRLAIIENVSSSAVKLGTFTVYENVDSLNRFRSQEVKEMGLVRGEEKKLFAPEYIQPGEKLVVPLEMFLALDEGQAAIFRSAVCGVPATEIQDPNQGCTAAAKQNEIRDGRNADLSQIEQIGFAKSRLRYPGGQSLTIPYSKLNNMIDQVIPRNVTEDIVVGPSMSISDVAIGDVRFNFRQYDAANIDVVSNFEGVGTCPFVFTYVDKSSEWINEGHVLAGHLGPLRKAIDILPLKHFDGTLAIRELESETTTIDKVEVRAVSLDGTSTVLKPIRGPIANKLQSLELRKGEEARFYFKLPRDRQQQYYAVVGGYYVTYGRPE